jgi:hypothetical protein
MEGRVTGTPFAKEPSMTDRRSWRGGRVYRAVTAIAVDETSAEQARRRAARWHAWLKNSECTFQDRENFERWCRDATNAAAYDALCRELAAGVGRAEGAALLCARRSRASPVNHPRLEPNEC